MRSARGRIQYVEDAMKVRFFVATVAMGCVVSACAGMDARTHPERDLSAGPDADYGKIIAVDRWAQRKGAGLVWVNYPKLPARELQGKGGG